MRYNKTHTLSNLLKQSRYFVVLRQPRGEAGQNDRPGEEDLGRRSKCSSGPAGVNSGLLTDQQSPPSGERSDIFQESDSSGGSGQTNPFPSVQKGSLVQDGFLATVLDMKIKRPTKPPQTLEEAQYVVLRFTQYLKF